MPPSDNPSHSKSLSQLGEFGLIQKIAGKTPRSKDVVLGIGDDAAAVRSPNKKLLLLTCDPIIEGIHFLPSTPPFQIGWKAMARNLSDIAAMGGTPKYAVVSAAFQRNMPVAKAMEIHRGLTAAAKRFQTTIVGGDTSHQKKGIHITVTLVGEVAPQNLIRRSGARAGDILCVTGTLGGSLAGKHLSFTPRIREAQYLAKKFHPSSMMDISDGLASDLQRLAEQSKVGFEAWASRLPISKALQKLSPKNKIIHALRDGEDYELVFTINPRTFKKLQRAWKKHFSLPLTQIGVVRPKKFGIKLLDAPNSTTRKPMPQPGNDHFYP